MALAAAARSLPLHPLAGTRSILTLRRSLAQLTPLKFVQSRLRCVNSARARVSLDGVSWSGGRQRWMAPWAEQGRFGNEMRAVSSSSPPGEEVAVEVPVIVEGLEGELEEVELGAVVEQLEIDAPLAVKLAIEGFEDFEQSDAVELSVMLCDDARIRELNKEWRGKDSATDVLSFAQDQPAGAPLMLLGDLVISVETAARQAEERGHGLIDELRILLVHGLLHVLDYDHELGPEASKEMEEEENRILSALGWKVKGLIHAASSIGREADGEVGKADGKASRVFPLGDIDSDGDSAVISKSKFRILFCDMDGTLLNTKSFVTQKTADALRAAIDAGVTVVIATGKTRPAAMAALAPVGLAGEGGVLSESTPGVFLQGLQVFGKKGKLIQNIALDSSVVEETFKFSVEHNVALVGFTGDRCVTLFSHPLIDELHDIYYEPKAEVFESLEELKKVKIQKVIFLDTAEKVASFLRPHWSLALGGRATVVQALPEMMEILPSGVSKGLGVQTLLDHLDVPVDEVMALGDGENDIEMLQLAGWGVSMANGAARTLAVANAITSSNDEDGVARAIEEYIL
ncbi:hypothetical protein M758_7G113900 [Ceratodon purpureus]|nr:hypothetical protein M758_7G113900 [Ceratodon purpureus]